MRLRTISTATLLALALASTFSCSRADDRARADSGAPATAAADTGESAAASAAPDSGPPPRPPAKDADQEFLRQMIDHHEGLVAMADDAMERASGAAAKADARRLRTAQRQEQTRMVAFVDTIYGERVLPTMMPAHRAMTDSLRHTPPESYDREFYQLTIAHHREGVQMIDQFLPRFTRPDVRQMAQQMKAQQQKEIGEFEKKKK